jgi:hypothetical protein
MCATHYTPVSRDCKSSVSKFPIIQYQFIPFNQFTPSLIERIGRKGVLEATIETPYGVMQVFNIGSSPSLRPAFESDNKRLRAGY